MKRRLVELGKDILIVLLIGSLLLLSMYLFTHLPYYVAPGIACALLAAFCRCYSSQRKGYKKTEP